jgi:hypothetical protein
MDVGGNTVNDPYACSFVSYNFKRFEYLESRTFLKRDK